MKKRLIGLPILACVFSAQSADRLVVAGGSLSELIYAMGVGNRVDGDLTRLRAIAGITHTVAWKNQRIVAVDQALILGIGPRIADAVEALHQQFWPH